MQKPLILVVRLSSDPASKAKSLGRESKLVGTGKDVNNSEGKRYYKAQGRGELSSIS